MDILDFFTSEDGNSSILDKAEDVLSVASAFFPQAILLKTVVGVIDSIVDPDNKDDRISNYDVMGILYAAKPSIANSLTTEKLSKISDALGIVDFALEKFYPNSKVATIIEDIHTIVDPDNKEDRITDNDVLGIVSKIGLSKDNSISIDAMKTIKNILMD